MPPASMRNLIFAVALLLVAAGSYALGRRHKATTTPVNSPSSATAGFAPADLDLPFAQNMTNAERGFKAASANLEDAIKEAESLPVPERLGFITGLFSFVARNKSPEEALKVFTGVPDAMRTYALRALVAEWINSRCPLDDDMRYLKREGTFTVSGSRLGVVVELSSMLASAKPDAELIRAWLDAFSHHRSRAEIFSAFTYLFPRDNPDALFAQLKGWTLWERDHFAKRFLWSWSQNEPEAAWDWYQKRREDFKENLSESILSPWLASDTEGAKDFVSSLKEPAHRKDAIEIVAKVLASNNTKEAAGWADGFSAPADREAARRAVFEGAPRGIGAVLKFDDGFAIVQAIVPGSSLEVSGVKLGDRIVELEEANGSKYALYGKDFSNVIDRIRGPAGSQVRLRILRQNDKLTEEHVIKVSRGQLFLHEKSRPNGR
jgi:hypothetical protein